MYNLSIYIFRVLLYFIHKEKKKNFLAFPCAFFVYCCKGIYPLLIIIRCCLFVMYLKKRKEEIYSLKKDKDFWSIYILFYFLFIKIRIIFPCIIAQAWKNKAKWQIDKYMMKRTRYVYICSFIFFCPSSSVFFSSSTIIKGYHCSSLMMKRKHFLDKNYKDLFFLILPDEWMFYEANKSSVH
jgi:hypothetical protein